MLSISPQFSTSTTHHQQQNFSSFISKERLAQTNYSLSIDQYIQDSPSPYSSGGVQAVTYDFPNFHYDEFHHQEDDDSSEKTMMKKLNHNASERDRRKKINVLYSTLRSLLPAEDQSRKLSIPATVSRVVRYIPELQKEVERLEHKKENLMSKISKQEEDLCLDFCKQMQRKKGVQSSSLSAVSATQISDQEIIIQISMPKDDHEKGSLSRVLTYLEMEGFLVLSASWSHSFERRVFYNLHIQGQGSQVNDAEILKEKCLDCLDPERHGKREI